MSTVHKGPQPAAQQTAAQGSKPVVANAEMGTLAAARNAGAAAALTQGGGATHNAADLSDQIRNVQSEMEAAQKSLGKLGGELGKAEQTLQQDKRNLSGLQPTPPRESSFASHHDFQKAQDKFNKQHPDHGAQAAGLGQAVQNSQGRVDALKAQVKAVAGQVDNLQAQVQSLKNQMPAAQSRDAQAQQAQQADAEGKQQAGKGPRAGSMADPVVRRAAQWQQQFTPQAAQQHGDLAGLGGAHEPQSHGAATSASALSDGEEGGRKPGSSGL